MADTIKKVLRQAKLDRIKKRRAIAWLLLLSMGTSMGVMWQMHDVGVAATAQYQCGLSEHIHEDGCYPVNVICGQAEGEGHTHDEGCVTEEEVLVCGQEEHTHGDECYAMVDELTCNLTTVGHIHDDACYWEETSYGCGLWEHIHTDDCYEDDLLICGAEEHIHSEDCVKTQRILSCGLDEQEPHEHTAECFTPKEALVCRLSEHSHDSICVNLEEKLICGLEEQQAHTHDYSCYTYGRLNCGMEHAHGAECYVKDLLVCGNDSYDHFHDDSCWVDFAICGTPEHIHDYTCTSNPEADLETSSLWERTIPSDMLTGIWNIDLLLVARSQVGNGESQLNFKIDENGQRQGYTRYGAFYGGNEGAYGEWSAKFVAFCLYYAGIGQDVIPVNGGAYAWYVQLSNAGMMGGLDELLPGSIVFFDLDEDGVVDHTAILYALDEDSLIVIEGDSPEGTVRAHTYDLFGEDAVSIAGVVPVPENEEEPDYDKVMDAWGTLWTPIETPTEATEASEPAEETTEATDPAETTAATEAAEETQEPEETAEASDPAETTAATEAAEETQEPEETAEASDPAETTAATEETTEASDPTETTVATEETTEATEETTEATEETTEATEEPEEDGPLGAYALSYEDGISLFAARPMRVMALRSAPEPKGNPLNLKEGAGGTIVTSVTMEAQEYEGGSWDEIYNENPVLLDGRSALRFGINYKVPAQALSSTNSLTYQMPMKPIRAESGDVVDNNGDTVGIYNIDENGKVDIIFNDDYVDRNVNGNNGNGQEITGFFRCKVSTKTLENEINGEQTYNFGSDQNIVIQDNIPVRLTLDKSVWQDGQKLKYTVRISSNKGTDTIHLKDWLQGDSGSFQNIVITKNGTQVSTIADSQQGFETDLAPLQPGDEYVITYEMPLTEMPDDGGITNKAEVTNGNDPKPVEREITYHLPNNLDVKKTGDKIGDRQITYTVTIESPYGTSKDVTVTDAFSKFDYIKDLDPNQITVTKTDKNGNVDYNVQKKNAKKTDTGFTMDLPKMSAGDKYTLTYTVDVDDIPGNNLYIYNRVNASDGVVGGSDDETVTIPQSSMKKTGVMEDGRIRWEITVNESKQNISGWTLKDYYNWSEYKPTASIYPPLYEEDGTPITEIELPYTFPEGTEKETYTIVYYTDSGVASNRPYNRAELTPGPGQPGEGIGTGDVTPPDWEPQNPLEKKGEWETEPKDGVDGIAKWTITIDRSLGDITGPWTFTESLQDSRSWFTAEQVREAIGNFEQALRAAGLDNLADNMQVQVQSYAWETLSLDKLGTAPEGEANQNKYRYQNFRVTFQDTLPISNTNIQFEVKSTVPGKVAGANGNELSVPNVIRLKDVEHRTEIKYTPTPDQGEEPGTPTPTLNKYPMGGFDQNRTNGQFQWEIQMAIPQNAECGYTLVDTLPQGLDLVYLMVNPLYKGEQQILPGGGSSGLIPVTEWDWTINGYVNYNLAYRVITENGQTRLEVDFPQDFVKKYAGNCYNRLVIGCNLNSSAGDQYGNVTVGPFTNTAHVVETGKPDDILVKTEATHGPTTITKNKVYKSHGSSNPDNTYQADTIPYKVVINPLGTDLLPEGDTLTLKDELVFTPTNKLKDISLVAGSVKLYELDIKTGARIRQLSIWEAPYTTSSYMSGSQAHRDIEIKVPDGMAIEVNYSYKLVGNEGTQVSIGNKATLYGVSGGHNEASETTTLKFQESNAGAQITGLSLIKVDEENAAIELSGAKFALYKWNGSTYEMLTINKQKEPLPTFVKDGETYSYLVFKNGRISLSDVDYNVAYKLKEIDPPTGYKLPDNTEYEFVLYKRTDDDFSGPKDHDIHHIGDGSVIRIANKRSSTGVTVFKVSADGTNLLENAVFELYKQENSNWVKQETGEIKTDGGGRVYLDKIDKGVAYKLVETIAPEGYIVGGPFYFFVPTDDAPNQQDMNVFVEGESVTIPASGSVLYVKNSPSASLSLKKVDADKTDKVLQGAEFDIYRWNGSDYVKLNGEEPIITDANGMAQLDKYVQEENVAYKLVETKAPDSYEQPKDGSEPSHEFYVKGDGEPPAIKDHDLKAYESGGTIVMTNKGKPNVTIEKVAAGDVSIKLFNAEFKLYRWDDDTKTYKQVMEDIITDKDGQVILKDLEFDVSYKLKEVNAPDGYKLPDKEFEFVIKSSKDAEFIKSNTFEENEGKVLDNGDTLMIENESDTQLTLFKRSEKDAKLKGAEFELDVYDDDLEGFKFVTKLVTDDEGQVALGSHVKEGKVYRLVETKAPVGYQKSPVPTYFKIDRSWYANTQENIEEIKSDRPNNADNAWMYEIFNSGNEEKIGSLIKEVRHWWPFLKAIPGDEGTDVRILNPDPGGEWDQGSVDAKVPGPKMMRDTWIFIRDYAIEDTQVSVTKHWNGDQKLDSIDFDLYRVEIPKNLKAGPGNAKLTIWDDETFEAPTWNNNTHQVDGPSNQGSAFQNVIGYYPEGSLVTFRVYYVHNSWDKGPYLGDGEQGAGYYLRLCEAYLNDDLKNELVSAKGQRDERVPCFDTYGELRYFTYTVKMDGDTNVMLRLPDNQLDGATPRWFAEILSVSLTESTASPISGGNSSSGSGNNGNNSGAAGGEQVQLTFYRDESYVGNGYMGETFSFTQGATVTFNVVYTHASWGVRRCYLRLDESDLSPSNGADGTVVGEERYYTYTVYMDTSKWIALGLDDNWADPDGSFRWYIDVTDVKNPEVTAPPATEENPGDNSGSTGETPVTPTITEGKPLEDLGGTKLRSYRLLSNDSKWNEITLDGASLGDNTIRNLPLTGYNAKGEPVFFSYYVKETSTGNFKTTYLNNGGIIEGEITIVNTPNDTPRMSLLKRSAETDPKTGKKRPLAGAVFTLQKLTLTEDGIWETGETLSDSLITDDDGNINLITAGVEIGGTYILTETKAPECYEKGENPEYVFQFDINSKAAHKLGGEISVDGEQKVLHILGNNYQITIENAEQKVDVKFLKVDGNNKPLAGAKFKLEVLTGEKAGTSWNLSSRTDGSLYTDNITFEAGVIYRLTETAAPKGYIKSGESFTFVIWTDMDKSAQPNPFPQDGIGTVYQVPDGYTYTAKNYKEDKPTTSITVEKVWKDTDGSPLTDPQHTSISFDLMRRSVTLKDQQTNGYVPFSIVSADTFLKTCYIPANATVEFRLRYNGTEDAGEAGMEQNGKASPIRDRAGYFTCELGEAGQQLSFNLKDPDGWEAEIISVRVPIVDPNNDFGEPYRDSSGNEFKNMYLGQTTNWKWSLTNLPVSDGENYYTYYIREHSVQGFDTKYETTQSTNADGTLVTFATVINTKKPSFVLPKTGSIGTVPFTVVGLVLMLGSLVIGVEEIRKSVRRRRNPKP